MIRFLALWTVFIAAAILFAILREERLVRLGRVPVGRLRRLWLQSERRRAPRYRLNWTIRYRRMMGGDLLLNGHMMDVGQTGAGLVVREILEPGTAIRMDFTPPGLSAPLSVTGQIAWVRQVPPSAPGVGPHERLFFVGIQFHAMDPQTSFRLTTALNLNPSATMDGAAGRPDA